MAARRRVTGQGLQGLAPRLREVRKYRADILCVLFLLLLVPLFLWSGSKDGVLPPKGQAEDSEVQKDMQALAMGLARKYDTLWARNPFTQDGKYPEDAPPPSPPATAPPPPPRTYRLLGVLTSERTLVAFKDDKGGGVVVREAGGKLDDGFVVASIDPYSVVLKRDGQETRLQMFKVKR